VRVEYWHYPLIIPSNRSPCGAGTASRANSRARFAVA
jgi:hypothetical protein